MPLADDIAKSTRISSILAPELDMIDITATQNKG